jgi:hypothetical protein
VEDVGTEDETSHLDENAVKAGTEEPDEESSVEEPVVEKKKDMGYNNAIKTQQSNKR